MPVSVVVYILYVLYIMLCLYYRFPSLFFCLILVKRNLLLIVIRDH